jgi:hypothetical protein
MPHYVAIGHVYWHKVQTHEKQNIGKQNKIIMHDKCNIWQPSFTPITKIKTIEKGTKTDIMKTKKSFKNKNKKIKLKERNK